MFLESDMEFNVCWAFCRPSLYIFLLKIVITKHVVCVILTQKILLMYFGKIKKNS